MTPIAHSSDPWSRHPFSGEFGEQRLECCLRALVGPPPISRDARVSNTKKKKVKIIETQPSSSSAVESSSSSPVRFEAPAWLSIQRASFDELSDITDSCIVEWAKEPGTPINDIADFLLACSVRKDGMQHQSQVLNSLSFGTNQLILCSLEDRLLAPIPALCASVIFKHITEHAHDQQELLQLAKWLAQHPLEQQAQHVLHLIDQSIQLAQVSCTLPCDMLVAFCALMKGEHWQQQLMHLLRLVEGWEQQTGTKFTKPLALAFNMLRNIEEHQSAGVIALISFTKAKSYPKSASQIAFWITAMLKSQAVDVDMLEELVLQAILLGTWEQQWKDFAAEPLARRWLDCENSALITKAKQVLKRDALVASIQLAIDEAHQLDGPARQRFACYLLGNLLADLAGSMHDSHEMLTGPISWIMASDPGELLIDCIQIAKGLGAVFLSVSIDRGINIASQWLKLLSSHSYDWWQGAKWLDQLANEQTYSRTKQILEQFLENLAEDIPEAFLSRWVADLVNSPILTKTLAKEALAQGCHLHPCIKQTVVNIADKAVLTTHTANNHPFILEILEDLNFTDSLAEWIAHNGSKGLLEAARKRGLLPKEPPKAKLSKSKLDKKPLANNTAKPAVAQSSSKSVVSKISVLEQRLQRPPQIQRYFPKRVNLASTLAALETWKNSENRVFTDLLEIFSEISKYNFNHHELLECIISLVADFSHRETRKLIIIYSSGNSNINPDIMYMLFCAALDSQAQDSPLAADFRIWLTHLTHLPGGRYSKALLTDILRKVIAKGWLQDQSNWLDAYLTLIRDHLAAIIGKRDLDDASQWLDHTPRRLAMVGLKHALNSIDDSESALNALDNINTWYCWPIVSVKAINKLVTLASGDKAIFNTLLERTAYWYGYAKVQPILQNYFDRPELYDAVKLQHNVIDMLHWWDTDIWMSALQNPETEERAIALLRDSLIGQIMTSNSALFSTEQLLSAIKQAKHEKGLNLLLEVALSSPEILSLLHEADIDSPAQPQNTMQGAITVLPEGQSPAIMHALSSIDGAMRAFAIAMQREPPDGAAAADHMALQSDLKNLIELFRMLINDSNQQGASAVVFEERIDTNKRLAVLLPKLLGSSFIPKTLKHEVICLIFADQLREITSQLTHVSTATDLYRPESWDVTIESLSSLCEHFNNNRSALTDPSEAIYIQAPWRSSASGLFNTGIDHARGITVWSEVLVTEIQRLAWGVTNLLSHFVAVDNWTQHFDEMHDGDAEPLLRQKIVPLISMLYSLPPAQPIIQNLGDCIFSRTLNGFDITYSRQRFYALAKIIKDSGLAAEILWNTHSGMATRLKAMYPELVP